MTVTRALPLLLSALLAAAVHDLAEAQTGGTCSTSNTINFCVSESTDGLTVSQPGRNERLGAALAFGDFNGDGFQDLASGLPGDAEGRGAVLVFPGSTSSIRILPQRLTQDSILGQQARRGEAFGSAVASGDFNNDGFADLAVSAPAESTGHPFCGDQFGTYPCRNDGVVHVFRGAAGGLLTQNAVTLDIAAVRFSDVSSADHGLAFGHSLAAGDLDGDGFDELYIGAPFTGGGFRGLADGQGAVVMVASDASGFRLDGGVNLVLGAQSSSALGETNLGSGPMQIVVIGDRRTLLIGNPFFDSSEPSREDVGIALTYVLDSTRQAPFELVLSGNLPQTAFGQAGEAAHDAFGHALTSGDFNGDGRTDLAIAAPGKDLAVSGSTVEDAGRVYVVYGTATGFNFASPQVFDQRLFPGQSLQANDALGFALAAADLSGDGLDDLLIGTPGEASNDTGFVYFLVGSAGGRLQVASAGSPIFSGGFNFSQATIGGSNATDDHFGMVLAATDVTGDGQAEIAIGVPDRDIAGQVDAGQLYVTRRLQIAP